MRTKKIVAIGHKFNSTTSYIAECHLRQSDQKYIITGMTEKEDEAHDFENQTAAKAVLIRINNPYDREYFIAPLTIKGSRVTNNSTERIS